MEGRYQESHLRTSAQSAVESNQKVRPKNENRKMSRTSGRTVRREARRPWTAAFATIETDITYNVADRPYADGVTLVDYCISNRVDYRYACNTAYLNSR